MKIGVIQSDIEIKEAKEDIFYGQIVFILARWFIIVSALFLIVSKAKDVDAIRFPMIPLTILIAGNFFIHGRYVMRKPANAILLTLATFVDLVIVTLVIVLGKKLFGGGGMTGIENPFFVLYYPIVLAFSLVFPRSRTLICVALLLVVYALICLLMEPGIRTARGEEEVLAVRLVTILCTALLGTMYWRIQRSRRRQLAT